MGKPEYEGYSLIDDIDRIVKNLTTLRKDDNYTLIAASYKLAELQTENELLRQALERAIRWLETAAMACDEGGSQYGDAAMRALKVLNTEIRVNRIPTEVATMSESTYNFEFGCSPAQYHHGVAKLWAALGKENAGPQDVDVFTQSFEAIEKLRAENNRLRQALESAKRNGGGDDA